MDIAELILRYVQALVWPTIVVVAVVLLRGPIVRFIDDAKEFRLAAGGAKIEAVRDAKQAIEAAVERVAEHAAGPDDAEAVRREEIETLVANSLQFGWVLGDSATAPPEVHLTWGEDGKPEIDLSAAPQDHPLAKLARHRKEQRVADEARAVATLKILRPHMTPARQEEADRLLRLHEARQ